MDQLFLGSLALSLALIAAGSSWILSFVSARAARRMGAIDHPTGGRKIHVRSIPLLGGLGIGLTILLLAFPLHGSTASLFTDVHVRSIQVTGFFIGIVILLIGGILDDRFGLPARWQFLFPLIASLVVLWTGTGIIQVTNPLAHGAFSLSWWHMSFESPWHWDITLPSDLLTIAWLLVATYAVKILDGLDGLVTGLTVIGSGMVAALSLSLTYFQPPVALLAGLIGGSYLGFLPRNVNPAKQFLGESGSTIAGFSLGFLAILSSAKVAIALSVLAIPIADVAIVILGRIRRGQPWFRGDDTHLHFRLIKAGLSQRAAVLLYWGVSLVAGIFVLSLQTRGKIFFIILLCVATALASYIAGLRSRRAGKNV